jgi:hypothetical protein
MMQDVRAVVVGVSRYQIKEWNTEGPARNAYAIVEWLARNKVPTDRIHLFMDSQDLSEGEKKWLGSEGISIRKTSFEEINRFWRQELSDSAAPGEKLFVFWSGHGVTDSSDRRLFFCSDFATNLTSSVFNASEFIANLRGGALSNFAKQLVLADVCGTYAEFRTSPTDDKPHDSHPVRQLTVFASPDGEYTRDADGFGAFTGALLEVLRSFECRWPEQEEFLKQLDLVVRGWEQKPFRISWRGAAQIDERRTGPHQRERNEYAISILSLLSSYPIAGEALRRPYALTVSNLGNSSLASVHSLTGMIDELANLQDDSLGGASFGLVQFLARLASNPTLSQERALAIEQWIDTNSVEQVRAEVQMVLETERQSQLLLLRIDNDSLGNISGFQAFLRYPDLSPVRGFKAEFYKVSDWSELSKAIRRLVEEGLSEETKKDLKIHFLVDPPLFDLPFHRVELASGEQLGEQHVCVVHYRARALKSRTALIVRWKEWLQQLADAGIVRAPLLEISMKDGALPGGKGICYASFAVGPQAKGKAEKEKLGRILLLGAPYLCWSLAAENLLSSQLPQTLNSLFCQAIRFAQVPEILLNERIRNCPIASQLTVLWDDPLFDPFSMTAGVQ